MDSLSNDVLNWAHDKQIMAEIKSEILYYSNKILKIKTLMTEERNIVLTEEGVYYFHKKKMKKKIPYMNIFGITYSTQNNNFILHLKEEENDYYYQSADRMRFIQILSSLYENKANEILKIAKIDDKNLKTYITSKKDKKKNKDFSKMDLSKLIPIKQFLVESQNELKAQQLSGNMNNMQTQVQNDIKVELIFSNIEGVSSVNLEDFKIIKVLGRGEYGKVYLVHFVKINTYFAMKSIQKKYLEDENDVQTLLIDQKFLQNINYPFFVGIQLCFHTNERLYFIMNLINGQTLSTYLLYNKKCASTEQFKFYAAIIAIAIGSFHVMGLTYRELRPDNILIDQDGYLRIPDFKLAKLFNLKQEYVVNKESSEYTAPEILCGQLTSYIPESDWWTYGIILYELLYGVPPFFGENDNKIKERIVKQDVKFLQGGNNDIKDLIKQLLNKNPNQRLGHQGGVNQVLTHPFFNGMNFDALMQKRIHAPYIPTDVDVLNGTESSFEISYEDYVSSKTTN